MKEFSSILKRTDSSAFRARVCLFLLMKKVVSCCIKLIFVVKDLIIVISSEKGYCLLSMSVLRENIIHLTVKFSLRYCEVYLNVKATHNC